MKFANHYLLASIFLVFFLGPIGFDYGLLSIMNLEILFLTILTFSIFLHEHNSKLFKLTVISLLIILINILFFDFNQSVLQYFLKLFIISVTIIELFKEIIRTKKIDFHIISSAISIYILIGIFWYLLFSFTTLTTLGYGDITPVSYTAKMWSITEAMIGVMFLAVMISRVVSLFGSKKKN